MKPAPIAAWLVTLALVAPVACSDRRIPDFHGVRLGMTPSEVRDRFDLKGSFGVEAAAANDDVGMRFTPASHESVASAKFEFHMGALVAVRADVDESDASASGDEVVVTRGAVLHRSPIDKSVRPPVVHVDWLSRDCPTHKVEADSLVKKHGG